METRLAEFFIGIRRGFDLKPWATDKLLGEIAEVNGRLVGICTAYLGNNETVNVYDIESGLSIASMAKEYFNSERLHDCVEDFDKDSALGGAWAELLKNFTELTKAEYDKYPEIKRQVFEE